MHKVQHLQCIIIQIVQSPVEFFVSTKCNPNPDKAWSISIIIGLCNILYKHPFMPDRDNFAIVI